MTQRSASISGSKTTCGTLSPHFFVDTRLVQRSYGSETWVSTSMTLIRSAMACGMEPSHVAPRYVTRRAAGGGAARADALQHGA